MTETEEERISICALNKIFGFKPKTAISIIEHLGSAAEVFKLSEKDLEGLLGIYSKYTEQISNQLLESCSKEIEEHRKSGGEFITLNDNSYPALLKECEDRPLCLYFKGISSPNEVFNNDTPIAIVGTRDLTYYGKEWTTKIIEEFALTGKTPLIISGLAFGTDYIAHKAALENNLPTVAVMATGPEKIYPRFHTNLAEKIANTPGCGIITDYPYGTTLQKINFIRRNRIIAGMSSATILIESGIKGGGMLTAGMAFDYNRPVLALPGRADDMLSQGCNRLIKQNLALPITSISDALKLIGRQRISKKRHIDYKKSIINFYVSKTSPEILTYIEIIIKTLEKYKELNFDEISNICDIPYNVVSSTSEMMRYDGFIEIDLLQRCRIIHKSR